MAIKTTKRQFWSFMTPGLILFTLIIVLPISYTFVLSFFSSAGPDALGDEKIFVGFKHFFNLARDGFFLKSLALLFLFILTSSVIEISIATSVALYFDQVFKVTRLVQTLVILPMFVIPVVSGLSFRYMFDPENGIIGSLFFRFQKEAPDLLGSNLGAFCLMVLQDVWRMWPFLFIIIFAGLQSLPNDMLEAAKLDGANFFQRCRYVILPNLKYTILIASTLKIVESFKAFTEIFVMTGGGPGDATSILSLFIVNQITEFGRFGYGSAASMILLGLSILFILILGWVQNQQTKDLSNATN